MQEKGSHLPNLWNMLGIKDNKEFPHAKERIPEPEPITVEKPVKESKQRQEQKKPVPSPVSVTPQPTHTTTVHKKSPSLGGATLAQVTIPAINYFDLI